MVRNPEVKARKLGIRLEDYRRGNKMLGERLFGRDGAEAFVEAVRSLPEPERTAVIKWDAWNEMYPGAFDDILAKAS